MKSLFLTCLLSFVTPAIFAQTHLGTFETGDEISFMVLAADPETGSATTPEKLSFDIMKAGTSIYSGSMAAVQVGVATGSYSTTGNKAGQYEILISGEIGGIKAYTHQNYRLVDTGQGLGSIADFIHTVTQETRILTREHSRSRLWFAQNTINSPQRNVPADMPSHIEIQVTSSDDPLFLSPLETYFHIYYYPNSATSTRASKQIRSSTPPVDGSFYLSPNLPW